MNTAPLFTSDIQSAHAYFAENTAALLKTLSTRALFKTLSQRQEGAAAYLQDLIKTHGIFKNLQTDDDLPAYEALATRYRTSFDDVVVLGTGGSSLGAKTLTSLRATVTPQLHFMDNIDPKTFRDLFSRLDCARTGVIAISKSGNTAETLMQLLTCLAHWEEKIGETALADHFAIVTESPENGIAEVGRQYGLPQFVHPHDVGGRFCVFTIVGALPGLIAGMDVRAFRQGARDMVKAVQSSPLSSPALQGALVQAVLSHDGCHQSVLMPYVDQLDVLSFWYRQLWAESLGKMGQGTTPINALGTVDQHSQLQLYLDGPKDKFFTVITHPHEDTQFVVKGTWHQHDALRVLQGRTMGDLMRAEQQATIDTLQHAGAFTRVLALQDLSEKTLGNVMMHFILETLSMSYFLSVNPFDQPAVEDGKVRARAYLQAM